MSKTFLRSRLHFNKNRTKPNPKLENNQSPLPSNLQIIKQKILSRNGFLIYKRVLKILK